jgi:hypothetical protein
MSSVPATAGRTSRPRGLPPDETDGLRPAWIDGPWVYVVEDDRGLSWPKVASTGPRVETWRPALRLDPCCYCGRPVLPSPAVRDSVAAPDPHRWRRGTVEHLTPRREQRRGEGLDDNTVGACRGCNLGRGRLTLLDMLLKARGLGTIGSLTMDTEERRAA